MRSLGKPGATTPRSRSASVLTHLLAGATAAALGVSMLGASPAAGVIADPLAPEGPSTLDVRRGDSVAPTAGQREAVRALGATARFNRFGTPQSLINRDGYLAEGISAPDAAAAAEKFLLANRELFRLDSMDGLQSTGTRRLAPGAFAVGYQQQVDGLPLEALEHTDSTHRSIALGTVAPSPAVDAVRDFLRNCDLPVLDVSEHADEHPTWPAVGQAVGRVVSEGRAQTGVAFCWTGSGVAISASSVAGCRSTFCSSPVEAKDARQWHDANVLALSLTAPVETALDTVKAWLETQPFDDPQHVVARGDLARLSGLAS